MSNELNTDDRRLAELLKKGLQQPLSPDFDDRLMDMIVALPLSVPAAKQDFDWRLGQRFLSLALGLLLISVFIFGYLLSGYFPDLTQWQHVTANYIFFGGFILFFLLIFFLIDTLLAQKYTAGKLSGLHGV